MPQSPPLDETEIVSVLQREYESSDNYWEELRDEQYLAQRFYEAKPFGNEVDGQSQVILPDVQETIDSMTISVLATFASGDRVVEIEAVDEAEEDLADEATAAIGFNFMRQQDGYRILHDWATSGLLEKIGITKSMMVTEEKVVREQVQIADPVQVELAGAEIEHIEPQPDGSYIADIRHTRKVRRSTDITVPASEFRFTRAARNEDDANYLAHVCLKTRSELVELGFDRDQVYSLPARSKLPDSYDDRDEFPAADSTPALEQVLLCEEYARIDIDRDGIAERVKVSRVENEILIDAETKEPAIEQIEDQPFTVFCPFPKPHQLVGYSLADKVMDIQLIRSTAARQLFDGMRNANLPRPIVTESGSSENTIDDLLSPIAGSPIRVKTLDAVKPYTTTFDVSKSMAVMEWLSREGEARSGTSRTAPVLDSNTLNTQTATEYSGNKEDGQARQEFVARNLAEAFSRLVAKKYRMMRREGEPFKVKVDGQYRLVDPSRWPEEINITIRVGLGTGSKEKRIQYRMTLVPLMAEGSANGKVSDENLFNMMNGLVRDMGLGQGSDYWKDPNAPPEIDPQTGQPKQEPEKPDPEMAKVQADAQVAQQKTQLAAQEAQQKIELQQQESAARMEIMHTEGQQKITLEATKAEQAQRLAEQRAQFEANLARETADRNYELALIQEQNRHELAMRQADHAHAMAQQRQASVPQERPGGALDR